jgi:glutathione peroxidase
MKSYIFVLIFLLGAISINCFQSAEKPANMNSKKSIYEYSFKAIDGSLINFSQYRGKKILVVNVASKCGFTPQYEDLEKLYQQYKEKLVIIGFPANNFKNQEPGSNEEISEFCKINYGVTFPLAEKISVIGDDQNEIYKWLTDKSLNGWNDLAPKWNFYKYLISDKGELVKVFPSTTTPMSKDITDLLQ